MIICLLAMPPAFAHTTSNDAALAQAVSAQPDDGPALLSPDKAFNVAVHQVGKDIVVNYKIADGYYLYRDRMTFETSPAGAISAPQFSTGEVKEDNFFGSQVVFKHSATAKMDVKTGAPRNFTVKVHYQGCAAVGVCYPPQTHELQVDTPLLLVRGARNPAPVDTAGRKSAIQGNDERCSAEGNEGRC